MKKLALLFSIFFLFALPLKSQVSKNGKPNWVRETQYNLTPDLDLNENSQGLLNLLYDNQINNNTKQTYYRFVSKITENVGIQPASSIDVSFDPTYQKLSFHKIDIIRNGKVINKLNTSDFQLIRKELDSESYIYDGSLSAISNISDVRLGDIIDYSFTITGFNPIHKGKFSTSVYLNDLSPIGLLTTSIISKTPLEFQYEKTSLKFKSTWENNSFYYSISDKNINAVELEDNTPSWDLPFGLVYVSDYKSWSEVTNWGANTFAVTNQASKELQSKIDYINKQNKTVGDKIKAVLDFVQNEIRYLGLESGIGAYKPFSPNKVFEQRFGDCKDKSLLMSFMLNRMKIESYPMLVSTNSGKIIPTLIPSPKYFNHCIVKVIDDYNEELWFDPTLTNQGGGYRSKYLPNYEFGLVLKKGNNEFDEIKTEQTNSVQVVDELILEEVGKGATLKSTTVYYDGEADFIRSYFKNNSISSIKKEYENFLSQFFDDVKTIEDPKYDDDLEQNRFTVTEFYKIDSIWTPYPFDEKKITTVFQPYNIVNILSMPSKRERKTPYELYYPSNRKHTLNIKLPQRWGIKNDFINVCSPEMDYDFIVDYSPRENLLTLKYMVKVNKSYVEAEDFNRYYDNMKKVENKIAYTLIIPKNGKAGILSTILNKNTSRIITIFLIIIVLIVAVFIGYGLYQSNINNRPINKS